MTETARLEGLEFKLAHVERGQQELSDVVLRQQKEIEQLGARLAQVLEQLEGLLESEEQGRESGEML